MVTPQTLRILREGLDALESRYQWWLRASQTTEDERQHARERLQQVEEARAELAAPGAPVAV